MCLCVEEQQKNPTMERATEEEQCLVINSVLFAVDPAEHFGKFGSQWEEADCDSYNRHRFTVIVHLEEDGIVNGMSTF